MKKHFLPFALMLFAVATYASTVSVSDAQNVALNFFKANTNSSVMLTATLKYTKTDANNTVDFYVFDMSPVTGFVIVAGDDNIIPILGYSTESSFHTNFTHVGLGNWVNNTATNISLAIQHNTTADTRIQSQWIACRQAQNISVLRSGGAGPLCTTTWDQENGNFLPHNIIFLYNLFCPYNATDSQRALTGCVATAQAQIMKYWNYPATGTGSFTYVDDTAHGYSNNYGTLSSDFATHTYDWTSMPSILTNSTSGTQDTAVGLLMYDCAVSVGMDFGDDNQNGSGANGLLSEELVYGDSFCSQYALPKYFGYDPDTIQGVVRSDYTDSVWTLVIEHEINVGRPVLYEGNDASQGGHAWVCDGYDANNNLHMNWGWSGFSNGYFAVTNLTTPGNYNPVLQNDALIGIMPKVIVNGVSTSNTRMAFKVFPNPAANDVILQTSGSTNSSTWEFKNIVGQTLIEGNIEGIQTHINTTGLAGGVYFVVLHDGDKTVVTKLVINR